MPAHDWLVLLSLLINVTTTAIAILLLVRCTRGVNINVTVKPEVPPAPPPIPAVDIAELQANLDKLEADRRKGQENLENLVAGISDFMTGGKTNGI